MAVNQNNKGTLSFQTFTGQESNVAVRDFNLQSFMTKIDNVLLLVKLFGQTFDSLVPVLWL